MSNNFEIRKLNIRQTIFVYNKSLKHEFPPNERRPLTLIIKGMVTGKYECLGAFYKERMVGYAFFLKHGNDYLWDYLAVLKKYRCKGIGTKIIESIKVYYKNADSVIGEVENPKYAESEEERKLMARRLDFYLRNGCIDTSVRTVTFGAHFIIIQISGNTMSISKIAKLYKMHYKASLPKAIYDGNINVSFLGPEEF